MSHSVDPRLGSELFGYRLEALLGRGGMSVVYRAHDLALDRRVALKLLAPELAEDERFRSRFLRESRMAASLDHPNVVPIYEAGESEGLLCIAMRYVEGTDLKSLLRREGALDPEHALAYCAQVAAALDAAHARGLVHRDVKPSNVLVAQGGHCYLADFGLTQDAADRSDLTQTGQLLGSVDYAAPEQIEGKPVDGRADVYSLGCLLYECLTASVPFPKDSELAVLWAHVNEPPPRLHSYPGLEPVLKRALAKRPDDRYATCCALVEAARAALPRPGGEPQRRHRLLVGLAALALAGGLAAGLALTLVGGSGSPEPDLTVHNNTLVRIDPKSNKIAAVTAVGLSDTGPVLGLQLGRPHRTSGRPEKKHGRTDRRHRRLHSFRCWKLDRRRHDRSLGLEQRRGLRCLDTSSAGRRAAPGFRPRPRSAGRRGRSRRRLGSRQKRRQ